MVSQPGTLSLIEMGWVYNRGEKFPVQEVTLEPWNLGEGGKDVGDYGFRFRAGGEWFSVQVRLAVEERGEGGNVTERRDGGIACQINLSFRDKQFRTNYVDNPIWLESVLNRIS